MDDIQECQLDRQEPNFDRSFQNVDMDHGQPVSTFEQPQLVSSFEIEGHIAMQIGDAIQPDLQAQQRQEFSSPQEKTQQSTA